MVPWKQVDYVEQGSRNGQMALTCSSKWTQQVPSNRRWASSRFLHVKDLYTGKSEEHGNGKG